MNAITVSAPAASLPALGWYRLLPEPGRPANIVQLVRYEQKSDYTLAFYSFGCGSPSCRLAEAFAESIDGPATADEVTNAKAAHAAGIASTARQLNTVREGT